MNGLGERVDGMEAVALGVCWHSTGVLWSMVGGRLILDRII